VTPRVFVGEIWGPAARPEKRDGPSDPEALSFAWTDETIAILAVLHEILLERIAYARSVDARRHVRVGLAAVGILEKIVTQRPRGVVLEPDDVLGAGLFVYFDVLVMQFRAMGIVRASQILRRMGWRLPRDEKAIVHTPTPRHHASYSSYSGRPDRRYMGDFRSPEKGGAAAGAPSYRSPDGARTHASPEHTPKPDAPKIRSEERPPRKTGGPFYTPSR